MSNNHIDDDHHHQNSNHNNDAGHNDDVDEIHETCSDEALTSGGLLLQRLQEENFDLQATIATLQAERKLEVSTLRQEAAAIESKLRAELRLAQQHQQQQQQDGHRFNTNTRRSVNRFGAQQIEEQKQMGSVVDHQQQQPLNLGDFRTRTRTATTTVIAALNNRAVAPEYMETLDHSNVSCYGNSNGNDNDDDNNNVDGAKDGRYSNGKSKKVFLWKIPFGFPCHFYPHSSPHHLIHCV
jgi:hypothetical protein